MKVFVTRSSGFISDGQAREYENLEECVNTLLEKENYGKFEPELVISKPATLTKLGFLPGMEKDCEYVVEIYDTWRE